MSNKPAEGDQSATKALLEEVGVLRQIANCLAVIAMSSRSARNLTDTKRMDILRKLGFDNINIAAILQSSPGSVSAQLSKVKTRKKRKPKAR
jgi:hypothetical protein